ncbi:hypothetical protein AC249_AIPGENE25573 [Exaiptasia diaphana]|nr:hypothetical protein AC249_AIPGENE25573 [Exaiptasia diaphana]
MLPSTLDPRQKAKLSGQSSTTTRTFLLLYLLLLPKKSDGFLVMEAEQEIKTMKLYHDVERIYKELKELGYSMTDPLKVEDVSKFDEYHYYGTSAVMECIKRLGLSYSEDFYKLSDFESAEIKSLLEDVYAPYLPSKDEYIKQMKDAGFTDIQFEDLTDSWRTFVNSRYNSFIAAKERHVGVLGQETYDALFYFYSKINAIFNESTHVGGCRIIASKA